MPPAKRPKLDPATLREVADEFAELARRFGRSIPGTPDRTRAVFCSVWARVLRGRATREEKRNAR